MRESKIFDQIIDTCLKELPKSRAAETIRLIKSFHNPAESHYNAFNNFAGYLGIGTLNQEEFDTKTHKTMGYIPHLKYHPGNKLGENPREEKLAQNSVKLKESHELNAQALLNRITDIPNLKELLENYAGNK